jgi:hypothetical protein
VNDERKNHFLDRIIGIECQYFSTQPLSSEDIFNHYLGMGVANIVVSIYATDYYLKFVKKHSNDRPKFAICRILTIILDYF